MRRVTVLMPVYNGEAYLAEAIESILGQSFDDFELLIVDDGSTDGSADLVRGYRDPRLRLLQNPTNLGITSSLNRGLDAAASVYVARMDADDASHPERLARQVAFMDAHPEVGLCGTRIQVMGEPPRAWSPVVDHEALACVLLFTPAFAHPTVMLRSDVLQRFGLRYDEDYPHAEDYELWTRCAELTRLACLPEPLLRYRAHLGNVSNTHTVVQQASAARIRRQQLAALGIEPSAAEEALHGALAATRLPEQEGVLDAVESWLGRLVEANRRQPRYAEEAFVVRMAKLWESAGDFAVRHGLADQARVLASPWMDRLELSPVQRAMLARRRRGARSAGSA